MYIIIIYILIFLVYFGFIINCLYSLLHLAPCILDLCLHSSQDLKHLPFNRYVDSNVFLHTQHSTISGGTGFNVIFFGSII